jgi:Cof subfamily protein (haloacid dehalogenase superfamily)
MKYSLLATDLDGTLLNDEKQIDLETIEAIQEFRRKGGKVIVCTGRSPLSATWIAKTIGLKDEPIIAYNGAIILGENGQVAERNVFSIETLLQFWKICREEGCYAHFYEGDTLLVPEENKWNNNWVKNNIPLFENSGWKIEIYNWYRKQCEVKLVEDFYDFFQKKLPKISKIAVFHEGKVLYNFSEKLSKRMKHLEISSSSDYRNLEISPKGVTKASALMKVLEKQGVSLSQAAAIGDNFNDYLMLSYAGLGIAMGNAPVKVKQIADKVTDTNNNRGMALAIRRFLLA